MYSAVITDNRSIHSARFPYVFIRDAKEGTRSSFTNGSVKCQPEGRHFSHADGCWLARYKLAKLPDGTYLATSNIQGEKDLSAQVVVKNGSVEALQ